MPQMWSQSPTETLLLLSRQWLFDPGERSDQAIRPVIQPVELLQQDAVRHLKLKENESLVKRNWLPVIINGCWVLARHVKRLGPNRLRISGHSYDYEIHEANGPLGDRIEDYNLVTTFKARLGGKVVNKTMLNGSVRMVIRFFLNHEEVLKPQFTDHKVIEGEV